MVEFHILLISKFKPWGLLNKLDQRLAFFTQWKTTFQLKTCAECLFKKKKKADFSSSLFHTPFGVLWFSENSTHSNYVVHYDGKTNIGS